MRLTAEQRTELEHLMGVAGDEVLMADEDRESRAQWLTIEVAYRRVLEGFGLTQLQRSVLVREVEHASDYLPCLERVAARL